MKVRKNYLFVCMLISIMFSLGAVAASENIASGDNDCDIISLSSDDVVKVNQEFEISNAESTNDANILNSSNDEKVGSSNNDILKTDVNGGTFADIRSAIASTSPGGIVFLNGQNYSGNSRITIDRNITIDGASSLNTNQFSILNANKISRIFVSSNAGYHIILKNLIFENPAANAQGYFTSFARGNITFSNIIVRNQKLSGNFRNAFSIAAYSTLNVCNVTFENNTIDTASNPVTGVLFNVGQLSNISISNLNYYDNKIISLSNIQGGVLNFANYCNVEIENINYQRNF